MVDEDERRLKRICQVLNQHDVEYVVFGSFAGRLQGAPLETVDVDIVPRASEENLQRLCDALNSLNPRWRVDDVSGGLKIDGERVEPRHIRGSSVAIGLVTNEGLIDIVLEPKGYEVGYHSLTGAALTVDIDGTPVRVGALSDLIHSKELLDHDKDREHLPLLRARAIELEQELARSRELSRDDETDLGIDR
jgi:hypothetical protein